MKSFEELRSLLHKEGITIIEYNNMKIPCIIINDEKFNGLMKYYNNKTLIVESRLDIWHNETKDVFVNIILEFQDYERMEILLYANETLQFFKALAESGILALIPKHYYSNMIMIQLGKKERMEEAFDNIITYIKA